MSQQTDTALGAIALPNNHCFFRVWAPNATSIEVYLVDQHRTAPLIPHPRGYFQATLDDVPPGSLYLYRLDGTKELPDPASRFQPQGVHGPSQVMSLDFSWADQAWQGLPLTEYIIYELHIGTFTDAGTFEAIIPRLDSLHELGITAIELMPIAEFPGKWNWGYDGTALFAIHSAYGSPTDLCRLVDACHARGIAVILDVVYNHAGSEGNYLAEYGPYFSKRYLTSWGPAFNFDGMHSFEVRRFFFENALYWLRDCHIDAFRIDAADAILDMSAWTFLEELAELVRRESKAHNRRWYLMAEDNSNNARLTGSPAEWGVGLDARWVGDFHHAVHTYQGSDQTISRVDFGRFEQVVTAFRNGIVYAGDYSVRTKRRRGTPVRDVPADKIVVFSQNHDQVGNTETSSRSGRLLSFEHLKLLAGAVLLSPFIPLLFMGEEYGETAPFYFFADYSSHDFALTVAQGRRRDRNLQDEVPDPFQEEAFSRSRLNFALSTQGHHRLLYEFYRHLIHLRKSVPALINLNKQEMDVIGFETQQTVFWFRWHNDSQVFAAFNFGPHVAEITVRVPVGEWSKLVVSTDRQWQFSPPSPISGELPDTFTSGGSHFFALNPVSFALYTKTQGP